MGYSNGNLPKSELRPIAGGGELVVSAAAAWNALAAHVYKETGERISASEAYRDIDRQWYFWSLYQSGRGNLAAYPGTSNHGLAIAVDLSTVRIRDLIDGYGAPFGWSKSWSDAQSEWWHILYQPGHFNGKDPGPGYSSLPGWWKKVARNLKEARQRRLGKKAKRKHSDNPERRALLHKQIQALGRLIDRLLKRRKDAK